MISLSITKCSNDLSKPLGDERGGREPDELRAALDPALRITLVVRKCAKDRVRSRPNCLDNGVHG